MTWRHSIACDGHPCICKEELTPFVADQDFTLYVGDVRDVLRELPAESVDCVVTSPPYWGLRDYGTGKWSGGDPDCDHLAPLGGGFKSGKLHTYDNGWTDETLEKFVETRRQQYRDVCGKCGARRVDQQLGLEATPDEYVAQMIDVFREVRRVLAPHGTVWLNLGDSYHGGGGFAPNAPSNLARAAGQGGGKFHGERRETSMARVKPAFGQGPPPAGGWKRYMTGGDGPDDGTDGETSPVRQRGTAVPSGAPISPGALKPKDLVGIPWRVAFALQADGWWLRSDIIWSKPNPMPESVTDRPTKAHEFVFLLSKSPRYFFDQEAVREPHEDYRESRANGRHDYGGKGYPTTRGGSSSFLGNHPNGRNIRSVWEIPTQPFPEAHFATFPEALVERCVKAGCPEWVCRVCGKPRERIVARELHPVQKTFTSRAPDDGYVKKPDGHIPAHQTVETLGFTSCACADYRPGVVFDPFMGSGTTALVARRLGRHSIGVELNAEYAAMCAKRLQQLSLLAEGAV